MENSYTRWLEIQEEEKQEKQNKMEKGNIESYMIKKILVGPKGKKTHVLLTNGYSEVLERRNKGLMSNLVTVLNENSEEGCGVYELITIYNSH